MHDDLLFSMFIRALFHLWLPPQCNALSRDAPPSRSAMMHAVRRCCSAALAASKSTFSHQKLTDTANRTLPACYASSKCCHRRNSWWLSTDILNLKCGSFANRHLDLDSWIELKLNAFVFHFVYNTMNNCPQYSNCLSWALFAFRSCHNIGINGISECSSLIPKMGPSKCRRCSWTKVKHQWRLGPCSP